MNKKRKFTVLGIGLGILTLSVGLLIGSSGIAVSGSNYLEKELTVQKSVINTFDLNTKDLKPLLLRDVFDDNIAMETPEIRGKIASAISMLQKDNELAIGDFKPMIFLKGNDKVLIGIKHLDETITLTEFDISKEKPVKGEKQVKEVRKWTRKST